MWKYVNPGYGELLDEKLGTTKSTVYNPKNGVCIGGQTGYGKINLPNLQEVYIKCNVYFKEAGDSSYFNIYVSKDEANIGLYKSYFGMLGVMIGDEDHKNIMNFDTRKLYSVVLHIKAGIKGVVELFVDNTLVKAYNTQITASSFDTVKIRAQADYVSNIIISDQDIRDESVLVVPLGEPTGTWSGISDGEAKATEAANTPKVEVFIPKAVEPNPDPEPDPSPEQPTEKLFEFHYVPDEGVLPGLIFEQQTEDVINDIGNHAYFAQKTASKALKTGLEASKAARTALNAAQNAQSTADRATELANTGISKADAAQETADKALKKAEANEVSIAANSSSIATLQNTVNGQQTQLDGNLTNISGLKKQVAENKQSIDANSKGISQCMMTIQESQAYTTTDKTDANDLTDYGRIYLPNALLHCPSGVTYPVLLDVVPSYFGDSEIDDVVVQRVVDANGVSFYRLATEETADATITYNFGDWKSIDTRYLKLTGGTVTGETIFSGKLTASGETTFSGKFTASGETSVPTPSTENNSKTIANTEFVHGVVSDLVNGAPDALDTLQELATALGNDPNFSTTVLNKIGEKESKADAQIEHKRLQDAIPTKVSQLTNDAGYITKSDITEGSTPDLTPYMKKEADSDLTMDNHAIYIGDSIIDGSTGDFMIQTTGGVEIITGGNNMHLNVNGDAVATQNYVKANYVQLSNGHISINGSELWIE